MGGILSKWLVLHEHPVTGAAVTDQTVAAARQAYLDRCPVLREPARSAGPAVRHRDGRLPPGAALGRPEQVVVTARPANSSGAAWRLTRTTPRRA